MLRRPISLIAGRAAVVLLLIPIANALPLCGFREAIPLVHPRVRLHLTIEGKPLAGTNIELYFGKPSATNDLPYETGKTDSGGIVVTSELPAATFYVRVLSQDHQVVEFPLDTPVEKERHSIAGKHEFFATPLAPVEDSEPCCMACSVTAERTLETVVRSLRGVVVDPAGAVVLKPTIDVYRNEKSREVIAQLTTDDAGRFAWELSPGKYLVIFKACGFDAQKVVVTVGTNGWEGMRVALGIGGNCMTLRSGNEASITEMN